jgi:hypothetical protein
MMDTMMETKQEMTFAQLFGDQPAAAQSRETHLQKMRQQIAEKYGIEDPTQLRGRAMELQALRDNGLLIAVHCHGTSMFSRRATWEELGIPHDDPRIELLRAGMKDVIPSEVVRQLKSLEARKRANLDRYGFQLPAFPGFRWVPAVVYKSGSVEEEDVSAKTNYELWKEQDDAINAELAELKAQILANLAEWTDVRLPEVFTLIAHRAWRQIKALRQEFDEGVDSFTARMIFLARRQMPSAADVEHGLYFTHSTDFLMNPTDVAQEMADRDRVKALSEAELQVIRAQAAAESARQRAEEDIAWERRRSEVSKLQAMREAEIAHAKERLMEMGSPFQAVLDQVEAQLYEAVKHMADKIREHGMVRGKTKEMAMNAIEQYQALRSLGGDRLHAEIEDLRQALVTPGDGVKTDPGAVMSALNRLAAETIEAAKRVARDVTPSRAAYVDF